MALAILPLRHRKPRRGGHEFLANLLKLGNELRSTLELGAVVRAIVVSIADTFGYRETTVYLLDSGGRLFKPVATVGHYPDIDARVLDTPVPAEVFTRFLTERYQVSGVYFIDHRDHEWSDEELALFPSPDLGPRGEGEWHSGDSLFVPLYDKRDHLFGVIDVFDPADRSLPTLEQIKFLELFANQAAVAIENARQYEELQQASGELEEQLRVRQDLLDLSEALLSTLDDKAVFEKIASMMKTLVDYDTMDIALVDDEAQELVTIFARDRNAEQVLQFRMPLHRGVTGWVVDHNQAQLVNDMTADPRGVPVPGTDREPQASIIVPLQLMGNVSGVLTIDRLGGRHFDETEFELTRLFANQAAIAINNARLYQALETQAITDGLTGVHNHRHFQETLSAEVSRAERYNDAFCLLMMDVDHFKSVNDTIGHQQGDAVLRAIATVLRTCSRESDYLARYGGEEFAAILPHTNLGEARPLAQRICEQVREIDIGAPGLAVTISVGIAAYPESAADRDGVLAAADAALLRAKAQGRDRVCTYTPGVGAVVPVAEGRLAALGRQYAESLNLSADEAAALVGALAVYESGGAAGGDALRVLGAGGSDVPPEKRRGRIRALPRRSAAFDALLYRNEHWDGSGYPEGLRGEQIPRVARAFAVCQSFAAESDDAGSRAALRVKATKELDPRFVDRFLALLGEARRQ